VACIGVVVLREIVVNGVLLCGCVGFGVGIGVRVERVLPRGGGMWSGVLRECSFSKWVCRILMTLGGWEVILLVAGSMMASSLG
jgi:hypothetical protein